jgi:hypothetical protein
MSNGYSLFAKLHPAGGLYRYKSCAGHHITHGKIIKSWKVGKAYLLTRWERPEGISKKPSLLNAFFLVDGKERCVDISFFKYLEMVE